MKPQSIPLDRPFLRIGRCETADLSMAHPDVSFRHAYLQWIGGRMFCVDLASRTGIERKTGSRLGAGWIDPDEDVVIGPLSIRLTAAPADGSAEGPRALCAVHPQRAPQVELEFLNSRGAGRGRILPVRRALTLVGASSRCKIQLKEEGISRVHCSLVLTPDGLWVVDLLGKDGIQVDGTDVEFAPLRDGSEIRVGRFRFGVRYGSTLCDVLPPVQDQITHDGGLSAEIAVASRPEGDRSAVRDAGAAARSQEPVAGISEGFVLSLVSQFTTLQQQMLAQIQQQTLMMSQLFGVMHQRQQELIREELARVHDINRELQMLQRELLRDRLAPSQEPPQPEPPQHPERPGPSAQELIAAMLKHDGELARLPGLDIDGLTQTRQDILTQTGQNLPARDMPSAAATPPSSAPWAGAPDEAPRTSSEDPAAEPSPEEAPEQAVPPAEEPLDERPLQGVRDHAWLAERMGKLERERNGRWQKIVRMLSGRGAGQD